MHFHARLHGRFIGSGCLNSRGWSEHSFRMYLDTSICQLGEITCKQKHRAAPSFSGSGLWTRTGRNADKGPFVMFDSLLERPKDHSRRNHPSIPLVLFFSLLPENWTLEVLLHSVQKCLHIRILVDGSRSICG